jgi:hypothetical protein
LWTLFSVSVLTILSYIIIHDVRTHYGS